MKKRIIILFGLLLFVTISFADTHISGGYVSGTWTYSNSPYIIDGEITIHSDSLLTIELGVQVIFSGHYKFNIYGRFLAEGTVTYTIVFTAQDTTAGWHGLRFQDTVGNGQDSSKVVYCKLEYGKATGTDNDKKGGAIFCDNSSNILIKNCLITKNTALDMFGEGGGIYCNWSSPNLTNVTISGNNAYDGGGIFCKNYSCPTLTNVTIRGNNASGASGGGINCWNFSNPCLTNVTISENTASWYGGGIYAYAYSNLSLTNVTISENTANNVPYGGCGGGIFCMDADPILLNCILWNDAPQEIYISSGSVTVTYSDIQGGWTGTGNIDADPLFVDSANGDFHLTWTNFPTPDSTQSPCIDAGDPDPQYNDPDGTRNDMGAFYFDQGPHIPPGDVSGTWTLANSPYFICGEISIPIDSTLIIEPGVQVIFSGHYRFKIYGRLLAEGTATDTIVFTAQDTTVGWHSLRFWNTNDNGQDSSKVVYCKLEYGKTTGTWPDCNGGAIYCNNSSDILIKNCLITKNNASSNGGGIFCSDNSSPSLTNVTISENTAVSGGGICCSGSYSSLANVTISKNTATVNGGGIHCSGSLSLANVTISENTAGFQGGGICCYGSLSLANVTISENTANYSGGGIYCLLSNPNLINVTISGNTAYVGGGMYCDDSYPILLNCILWNDAPQEIYISSGSVTVTYSDIQGGWTGTGNIDADPLFADPGNGDFHLTWTNFPIPDSTMSPCINTGDPDSQYNDPDGTRNDMGACYFNQSPPGIISVTDVPNDQGRQVQVVWHRSSLDIPYSPTPIISYSVWRFDEIFERKSPSFIYVYKNPSEVLKQSNRKEEHKFYWQRDNEILTFITQLPAIQIEQYSVIAPTLFDSCATSCNYSKFEVIAHTDTVWVYFESEPDSGYSVDNLAPSAPQGFNGLIVGNQVELYWQPCPDEDFQYFALYKSNESGNYPDEPYAITIDTFYIDTNITYDPIYYVLTAFDYNGNESEYSEELLVILTDIDDNISDIPEHYSISKNHPNPFKKITSINYTLSESGNIRLNIYNLKGQLVETLINENKPAGYHTVEWNVPEKSDISSGLYFYRLITKDKILIKKMVLMK